MSPCSASGSSGIDGGVKASGWPRHELGFMVGSAWAKVLSQPLNRRARAGGAGRVCVVYCRRSEGLLSPSLVMMGAALLGILGWEQCPGPPELQGQVMGCCSGASHAQEGPKPRAVSTEEQLELGKGIQHCRGL